MQWEFSPSSLDSADAYRKRSCNTSPSLLQKIRRSLSDNEVIRVTSRAVA
jgi:hypothetical protein